MSLIIVLSKKNKEYLVDSNDFSNDRISTMKVYTENYGRPKIGNKRFIHKSELKSYSIEESSRYSYSELEDAFNEMGLEDAYAFGLTDIGFK